MTFLQAVSEESPSQALRDATASEPPTFGTWPGKGIWSGCGGPPAPDARSVCGGAQGAGQLQTILGTLPLAPWLTIETTRLSEHPNGPGPAGN